MRNFTEHNWNNYVAHGDHFKNAIGKVREQMEIQLAPKEELEDEDTEGEDLYKGKFSLAYGTLTLLRDAKMHLKKQKFYGLLGGNQCGKTTLMRAIIRKARTFEPLIPDDVAKNMSDIYVQLRKDEASEGIDSRQDYTTPRRLLALARLAIAFARIRFSNMVDQSDLEEEALGDCIVVVPSERCV